jgi:hypothetical protein
LPYLRRHSSITEKARKLKSSTLEQHAGWVPGSNMQKRYVHYFGNESSRLKHQWGDEAFLHFIQSAKARICNRRWALIEMVHFDASNPTAGTEYYDVVIDDPVLTEHGFTKFRLPLNGNAIKMILDNDKDRSMITYIDFDKHNLDRSVKLLHGKLVDEQQVEGKAGKDTVEGLVAYFRNTCISLQEDPSNEFFKDGNGKEKQRRSKEKQQQHQQRQEQQEQGKEKEKNESRIVVHTSIQPKVTIDFMRPFYQQDGRFLSDTMTLTARSR